MRHAHPFSKPKLPTGIFKLLRYLFFGEVIVSWSPLVLSKGIVWVPIRNLDRRHPYQKLLLGISEKHKLKVEKLVSDLLKIDLEHFYFSKYN